MLLTIGLPSWAVDLKTVGAIYPFQGTETAMAIAALVFWILWHIIQIGQENAELREKRDHVDKENARKAIERY
ncbi:MAG: hypothetical protein NW216_01910 [Hyphomicrobium sp.]|nr:hypothetical protein [Hyphomicrobium sp.]